MSKLLITSDTLTAIAAAIRAKAKSTERYTPLRMARVIGDLPTGVGDHYAAASREIAAFPRGAAASRYANPDDYAASAAERT